jgi:hypothetical protein
MGKRKEIAQRAIVQRTAIARILRFMFAIMIMQFSIFNN